MKKFKNFSPLLQWSHIEALIKIKDYTVKSKLYPLERNGGFGSCWNGRCQVCKNIKVIDTSDSFTRRKSYKINHKFDCNDKCLIYVFGCRTCSKQYTSKKDYRPF